MSLALIPPTTTIWHLSKRGDCQTQCHLRTRRAVLRRQAHIPATDLPTIVPATAPFGFGSVIGTVHQGTQGESHPPVCQIIETQTSVPAVDLDVVQDLLENTDWDSYPQMREPLLKSKAQWRSSSTPLEQKKNPRLDTWKRSVSKAWRRWLLLQKCRQQCKT